MAEIDVDYVLEAASGTKFRSIVLNRSIMVVIICVVTLISMKSFSSKPA